MSRNGESLIMKIQRSFALSSVRRLLSVLKVLSVAGLLTLLPFMASAVDKFETLVDQARGQSVYFNAWGGSPAINAYIAWAAEQLKDMCNAQDLANMVWAFATVSQTDELYRVLIYNWLRP